MSSQRSGTKGPSVGDFARAVETARANIPIMCEIVKPEFWCDYVIVRDAAGWHHVYKASAWTEPTERPLLPWHPPSGTRVATVDLAGVVAMLTEADA